MGPVKLTDPSDLSRTVVSWRCGFFILFMRVDNYAFSSASFLQKKAKWNFILMGELLRKIFNYTRIL